MAGMRGDPFLRELRDAPPLQGPEGRKLTELTEAIRRDLEQLLASLRASAEADELSYRSVPPSRVTEAHVRYHYRGRGKPLPYSLPDE